jgi:hypothetical protein
VVTLCVRGNTYAVAEPAARKMVARVRAKDFMMSLVLVVLKEIVMEGKIFELLKEI